MPSSSPNIAGKIIGVFVIIFGIFWTILAATITRNSPFPLVGTIFPLFGICFVAIAVIGLFSNKGSRSRRRGYGDNTNGNEEDQLKKYFENAKPRLEIEKSEASPEARLKQLEDLRSKGAITEEEYGTQRQRILNSL